MKKILKIILICILLITVCAGYSYASESDFDLSSLDDYISGITVGPLFAPADSSKRSDILADQLLGLSLCFSEDWAVSLFESAGLEILAQENFDKDPSDASHTCAYTIGKGNVFMGFSAEEALVVSVAGTIGGEWYSNFNFCPSHNDNAIVAENFLFCAENVLLSLKNYIYAMEDPIVFVCGYSRGAACANLLGVLLNDMLGPENIYVYTYATPLTIKSDTYIENDSNIFNHINSCDLVPRLPLKEWDFKRAGTDIIYSSDNYELEEKTESYIETFYSLAPSISEYYGHRYSLKGPGTDDEEGITPYELMLLLSSLLAEISDDPASAADIDPDTICIDDISFISDECDLKPLFDIYKELTDNDNELVIDIIMQHMPNTYYDLMNNPETD